MSDNSDRVSIPANIFYDKRLTITDMRVYVLLSSPALLNNREISKYTLCCPGQVSKSKAKLLRLNLIDLNQTKFKYTVTFQNILNSL